MSKQHNKVEKRTRRRTYIKRKKKIARTKSGARAAAPATV
jgi:hypothetical protein